MYTAAIMKIPTITGMDTVMREEAGRLSKRYGLYAIPTIL